MKNPVILSLFYCIYAVSLLLDSIYYYFILYIFGPFDLLHSSVKYPAIIFQYIVIFIF